MKLSCAHRSETHVRGSTRKRLRKPSDRGRAAEDDLFITSLLSRKLAGAKSTYPSSAEAEPVAAEDSAKDK